MIERVSFTSRANTPVDGALALPEADKAPGLVVVQEWWGLNDQIKRTCERFAADGFAALAPDLYHGVLATDAAEAGRLMSTLDWQRALDDIAGAVEFLRADPRTTGKVAITGFCMGGALAFAAAANIRGLAAVVPFYGLPGEVDWTQVEAAIQAHFATIDDWAKPEKAEAIQRAIEAAGGTMELHVYDAHHAFMNEKRPEVYSEEAAATAWHRAVGFLHEHTT